MLLTRYFHCAKTVWHSVAAAVVRRATILPVGFNRSLVAVLHFSRSTSERILVAGGHLFRKVAAAVVRLATILRVGLNRSLVAILHFSRSTSERILVAGGHIFQIISTARAPLIVSLFGAIALAVLPQTQEIYRIIASDFVISPWPAYRSLVALFAAAGLFWLLTSELLSRRLGHRRPRSKLEMIWLSLLPLLCGALLPLGMSIGLILAATSAPTIDPDALQKAPALKVAVETAASGHRNLILAGVAGFLISGSAIAIGLMRRNLRSLAPKRVEILIRPSTAGVVIIWVSFQTLVLAIVPVQTASMVGSMTLLLEFLIVIAYLLSLIVVKLDRYGWPAFSLIVVSGLFFSALNLNDNHSIRTFEVGPDTRTPFNIAFRSWLNSRADLETYSGGEYPVFVIAAAGGGLYAASHVATVLSRLQDRCPNFAQHVFAISGVSGGSLGAAVFSSLTRKHAANDKYVECKSDQSTGPGFYERLSLDYLDHDFLAPLLGATLFPDFFQRFIPFPINRFDRARALEETFVHAWSSVDGSQVNPFNEPFLSHWNPKGVAPALILNVTNVNRGFRSAIAPFWNYETSGGTGRGHLVDTFFESDYHRDFYTFIHTRPDGWPENYDGHTRDLSLSTAVALSARFPWVTPAGTSILVSDESGTTYRSTNRFVDGGYFENSGVDGAIDTIQAIRSYEKNSDVKIRVYLLAVTAAGWGSSPWDGLGELLSPIRTMLSTRGTRGTMAVARAHDAKSFATSAILLNLDDFPLPLGWQISRASQGIIAEHSGRPRTEIDLGNVDSKVLTTIGWNDHEICKVQAFLTTNWHFKCHLNLARRDIRDDLAGPARAASR